MKRKTIAIFSIIFVTVFTLLLAGSHKSEAVDYSVTVDGVTYTFSASGSYAYNVRVTAVTTGTDTINIPSTLTYNGTNYRVYSIGDGSVNILNSLSTQQKNAIKTITLPNTIRTIYAKAFYSLSNLENLDLGTSVYYIYDNAIYGTGIKSLTIPDSVGYITTTSLRNCQSLETLTIGKGVNTSILSNISTMSNIKEITVSSQNSYMKSEDNVIYSTDMKTILYAAPKAERNNYVMPTTVETINAKAFYNASFTGTVTLSPNLKTIGENAFYYGKFDTPITFPEGLISIGAQAFLNSTLPGTLVIPESVTTIGSSAFNGCKSLTGLQMGDGIQTLGQSVFMGCSSMTGEFTFNPSSMTSIPYGTFSGTKFTKFTVGSNITSIGNYAFNDYTDLWIDNTEGSVRLSYIDGNYEPKVFIHWRGDTHNLFVSALPGIKLIDTETNEELVSGDYECCTSFNYKVTVEDGYSYPNLSMIIIDNNDVDNMETVEFNPSTTYETGRLIRDKKILIQNVSTTDDLGLRVYIKQVNGININPSREAIADIYQGSVQYRHTKYPLAVKTNDNLLINVRVFNEGLVDSSINKVAVYLPDGITFVEGNTVNNTFGWTLEDGKYTSEYLKDQVIKKYNGNSVVSYIEIPMCVKVTAVQDNTENVLRQIFAEIIDAPNEDADSTYGNVDVSNTTSYMKNEIYQSNTDSHFNSQEDDDDFESVVINAKIRVEYDLKVDKIASDNNELLQGATFYLYDIDGNKIGEAVSDANGAVDFGTIVSYGEGIDVFYIKEIKTPVGFYLPESKSIKVEVEKTLVNEFEGTYSVVVRCDTREYKVDTSKVDYIPVSTAAQLAKIGSGETVTVDGTAYEYAAEANYQLTADIDLTGINWTSIAVEVKGVFDGNGHKISNLTISEDAPTTKEFGLFSVYTGIIENLELENVAIEVGAYDEDATSLSGKSGTGAIVGVMREGYIIDCTVSGSVQSSEDNLGGFVGHTLEDGLVVIDRCENNAEVTSGGKNNVGGVIGCALGSISVNNSTNKGVVSGGNYNNGGLVGYVLPSRYQDLTLSGANREEEQELEFYVTNTEVSGEYTVTLETIKKSDESLLPGATYTVYDSSKNVISGLDHVTLTEGRLQLFTKDINTIGTDVYYIKENETVSGYNKLIGVVRADIERYWDDDTHEYKVRVTTNKLTDAEFESDTVVNNDQQGRTGNFLNKEEIFTEQAIAKANWRTSKAEFINCSNTVEVSGICTTAGIVGASHGYTCIENCTNSASVTINEGTKNGKAAGIIAELYAWKIGDRVSINGCTNTGAINGEISPSTRATAGIAAEIYADARVTNCENSGSISALGDAVSGIVGNFVGKINIDSCTNSGTVKHTNSVDNYSMAGGILAKNYGSIYKENIPVLANATASREDNEIIINNCTSTGDIEGCRHIGAIMGMTSSEKCYISNCTVEDVSINQLTEGDIGGIIGLSNAKNQEVIDCSVTNLKISHATEGVSGDSYGHTGGIIGNWNRYGNFSNISTNAELVITRCDVEGSDIVARSHNVGGVVGQVYVKGNTTVAYCNVKNSKVLCDYVSGTYSCAAGVIGNLYEGNKTNINNCTVDKTDAYAERGSGSDSDMGGIIGLAESSEVEITDCTYSNGLVSCIAVGDGCANSGGIVGCSRTDNIYLENLEVNNAKVTTLGGNCGGILGGNNYKNTVHNARVIDSYVYNHGPGGGTSNTCTGGIVAYNNSGGEYVDCIFENSKVEFDPYDNAPSGGTGVAGICGVAMSYTEYTRCKVIDSEIIDKSAYNGYACIGGLVGWTNEKVDAEDCISSGNNIIALPSSEGAVHAANLGALVGGTIRAVNINKCTVYDCTLTNECPNRQSTNITLGGCVGSAETVDIRNSEVSKITLKGRVAGFGGIVGNPYNGFTAYDVDVSDITIIDEGQNQGRWRAVGGLFGSAGYSNVEITNVNIEDVDITSASMSSGLVFGYGGKTTLRNVNVSNSTLDVDQDTYIMNNNGGAGGIAGSVYGEVDAAYVTVDNVDITLQAGTIGGLFGSTSGGATTLNKCTVKDSTLTNNNEITLQNENAGGFIGASMNKLTVNDSTLNNTTVLFKDSEDEFIRPVGGFIGYVPEIDVTNSNVIGSTLTNPKGYAGGFAGIVADIDGPCEINVTNSGVKGGTTISAAGHVGGITSFGWFKGENITLNDVTLSSSNSSSCVGGVIAVSGYGSSIDGVTAADVTINSKAGAGGIAAVFKGTITDVEISDSEIKTTADDDTGYAGGIVGVLEGTLSNSTVDDVDVTSAGGNVGGAIGATTGTVDTVTVKNSTIQSPKIAGGVVGAGLADATTLLNLTIDNNTVTSAGTSGDYIGSPDIYNP